MVDATTYALLSVAAATSLLHTLIPDHWLPFVLIGRARGWAGWTVGLVSGLSALIHVALSVLLGLLALWLGLTAAEVVGDTLERAGAGLLVLFGAVYALWAWRKGGHFHPGGALLHREEPSPCSGEEGPANPEHLHYHADGPWIGTRPGRSGLVLALIIGINPCVVMLPLMLSSATRGPRMLGLVVLAYGLPTLVLMVGLSVLGVRGARRIRVPGAARRAELISGLLVAALGLVYLLVDG